MIVNTHYYSSFKPIAAKSVLRLLISSARRGEYPTQLLPREAERKPLIDTSNLHFKFSGWGRQVCAGRTWYIAEDALFTQIGTKMAYILQGQSCCLLGFNPSFVIFLKKPFKLELSKFNIHKKGRFSRLWSLREAATDYSGFQMKTQSKPLAVFPYRSVLPRI